MRLKHVEIRNFRGINEMQWAVAGTCVCLIGPGDSTKSTILDAIDFVLSPRWSISFDDSDFFQGDTSDPITLRVTVGDLPDEFRRDDRFGHHVRGWSSTGALHDEPEDEDELVVTIQLRVNDTLEPTWRVVNDRDPDGRPITARDREKLGCARVGAFVDRHLTWSRGSLLSRMTGDPGDATAVLANAGRAARNALGELPREAISELYAAAESAEKLGAHVGVSAATSYRPHLDLSSLSINVGALALHEGDVPLRRLGLGSRRLLATALQRQAASPHGITLIDEIEHGLEPHRIRRLLRHLRGDEAQTLPRHVLMTTHAPVVIQELDAEQLRVVRVADGKTTVTAVPPALRDVVRGAAESLLARKVVVCEGKTEIGFCRALDEWWSNSGDGLALQGVGLAYGGGRTNGPDKAVAIASLGYDTAFFGDSDEPPSPSAETMRASGVEVWLWDGNLMIEARVARDLPWDALVTLVSAVAEDRGARGVRDAVADRLGVNPGTLAEDPTQWLNSAAEPDLRDAIARTAGAKKWFKSVEGGEQLGRAVIGSFEGLSGTDLHDKISAMRVWAAG